jgi:hypothetical protein
MEDNPEFHSKDRRALGVGALYAEFHSDPPEMEIPGSEGQHCTHLVAGLLDESSVEDHSRSMVIQTMYLLHTKNLPSSTPHTGHRIHL